MKQIKFRQRNKNNGSFHYWGTSLDVEERGGYSPPKLQDNYVDPDESEQYTGLKDINGTEIYENDTVRQTGFAYNSETERHDILEIYGDYYIIKHGLYECSCRRLHTGFYAQSADGHIINISLCEFVIVVWNAHMAT